MNLYLLYYMSDKFPNMVAVAVLFKLFNNIVTYYLHLNLITIFSRNPVNIKLKKFIF